MPALAPLMRPVHLVRGIRHFAGNVRCCHVAGDATPRTHLSARIQPSPLNRHLFTLESSDGRSIAPPANLDAIVVLAGGLLADGQCPEWVERRLDVGLGLQQQQANPLCPILCLGGGTPHKPPILGSNGHVLHESTSCAAYLMTRGLPADRILKEVSSYDTVGNAFFSLTIHALPAGWRKVAVVTSNFHMPRTRCLFQDMWSRAAVDILKQPEGFELCFASASDEGLFEDDVLLARCEKEAASLQQWQRTVQGLPRFKDVHAWLYATHQCYSAARQHEFNKATITDPRLLASY
ncbi:hypothetical protein QJQ45_023304 [Haematococcus lacustris]|nr:hypothetical protein QJQ45_023304 [Haematococcus lacustris]